MSAPAAAVWGAPAARPGRRRKLGVAEWFLLGEILFQLALLVPVLNRGPLRVLWRVGVFAASLALLALLRGKTRANPSNIAAFWVMALLALEVFHPTSNTWLAAIAEFTMYVAILAPLFWMTRLHLDYPAFRRTLRLFWGYSSLSATVGLLQVYFPGRFQPQLSPIVASMGSSIAGLRITLASGARIFRPMGLTDMPGGAADAGMWAVLFGLGFLLTTPPGRTQTLRRALYLFTMVAGMAVIYLSQTRVLLVVLAVWFASLLALLFWRRRWREFGLLLLLVALLGAGGLRWAAGVGGAQTLRRVESLFGGRHGNLYQRERGAFLAQTFHTLIPQYPLGAGLGRWGMMNTYFGDNHDPRRGLIYVEIQWQGWVLDGGLPLVFAYLALLALTLGSLARIARRRGPLAIWALLCLAYDVGALALTFDYTPFTGEVGLQFWFVNALVLAVASSPWPVALWKAPSPPPS
ncbi:MAG TPA: hypothetical protein VMV31_11995 [Terriglobales bacterium]|nr:hypothetical protein [Terriglobales bacterium]